MDAWGWQGACWSAVGRLGEDDYALTLCSDGPDAALKMRLLDAADGLTGEEV